MTRHTPVHLVLGAATAVVLAACGGGGVGVDQAAAEAGISSQQNTNDGQAAQSDGQSADGQQAGSNDAGGRPGGPGGDPGGSDGVDTQAQGNPGAPGDVAVFEEAGVAFSVLRDDADTKCADGVCHLASPVILDGNPDDVGGVGECTIENKSDILYDPPADGDFFQKGATVTAQVHCLSEDTSDNSTDGTDGDTTDTGNSDSSEPAGESTAADESSGASDQSQG